MIIFIRGIPGSGKTSIADKLGEKTGRKVIHVDDFKKEMMTQNPKAFFTEEVIPYSYKKTLEALEKYKGEDLIIEEIFKNKDFVRSVLDFCDKNNISYKWFIITRDIKKILEVNESRTRKVKNTLESLEKMQGEIDAMKIEGEVVIKNESVEGSVQKIVESVS
jgi:2-phosphoglycerate kinase